MNTLLFTVLGNLEYRLLGRRKPPWTLYANKTNPLSGWNSSLFVEGTHKWKCACTQAKPSMWNARKRITEQQTAWSGAIGALWLAERDLRCNRRYRNTNDRPFPLFLVFKCGSHNSCFFFCVCASCSTSPPWLALSTETGIQLSLFFFHSHMLFPLFVYVSFICRIAEKK